MPKVNEDLRSEIEVRETSKKAKEDKIKAIRESTRNHDYLREVTASKRQTINKVNESVTSLSNAAKIEYRQRTPAV